MTTHNDLSLHSFREVKGPNIQRSLFDLSHEHKTTFNSGYLVPIFVTEVLPGDTWKVNMTGVCRMATPLKPVMDNLFLETFFFYAPNRLLWSNWTKFLGEQLNAGDSTSFIVPTLPITNAALHSLADYFGIPPYVAGTLHANTLHFRLYNKMWNEWFRDANLQAAVGEYTGDGPDSAANFSLMKRGRRADYFTSCLPWPQRGTAQSMPLGTSAPIS